MWCTDQTSRADHAKVLQSARPEDAIEDTTVVHPRNATRLVRQHGLDGNPFIIGEFVAHDSPPVWKLESQGSGQTQRFWAGPGWTPYGVEADIGQRTISAETVENDVVDDARSRHQMCQRVIVEQRITGGNRPYAG